MTTQKIVPIGRDMKYLDAFNEVKAKGGLPSHVLQDDTLMNTTLWEKIKQQFSSYWSAWCRELIVYPSKYGVFEKGDIKDSSYGWVLQAKYVPKKTIGKKGVALLIDPKDLQVVGDQVRVIPRTITVLQKFPQTDGWYDYDKKTRIPIDQKPTSEAYEAKRYLWRRESQTLRPLARYGGDFDVRRDVDAVWWPYVRLGVGYVEPQQKLKIAPQVEESFKLKWKQGAAIKPPLQIKVKTGTSVEVTIRTL